jgi:hypothetical protein
LQFRKHNATGDRVQQALDALAYDFSRFELAHFVVHVANLRQKPIQIVRLPLAAALFGVWVPTARQDYIFCNLRLQPIHQTHVILHEIAHMLLNHRRERIDHVLPPDLLRELGQDAAGRLRVAPNANQRADAEEQESERFVYLIQRQVVRARRLAELTGESSSIPALKPITDAMGFAE